MAERTPRRPSQSPRRPRFHLQGFTAALDALRTSRAMSWRDVASITGVGTTTLSKMQIGRVPSGEALALLSHWSGLNPAAFVIKGD